MNFSLGFYRTRDGSIIELTELKEKTYVGRAVVSAKIHLNRSLYWNSEGDAAYGVESLDLVEFLKIKENNTHEGLPLKTYIEESIGTSSNER